MENTYSLCVQSSPIYGQPVLLDLPFRLYYGCSRFLPESLLVNIFYASVGILAIVFILFGFLVYKAATNPLYEKKKRDLSISGLFLLLSAISVFFAYQALLMAHDFRMHTTPGFTEGMNENKVMSAEEATIAARLIMHGNSELLNKENSSNASPEKVTGSTTSIKSFETKPDESGHTTFVSAEDRAALSDYFYGYAYASNLNSKFTLRNVKDFSPALVLPLETKDLTGAEMELISSSTKSSGAAPELHSLGGWAVFPEDSDFVDFHYLPQVSYPEDSIVISINGVIYASDSQISSPFTPGKWITLHVEVPESLRNKEVILLLGYAANNHKEMSRGVWGPFSFGKNESAGPVR